MAQMDKVKFLSPIEAPNIDATSFNGIATKAIQDGDGNNIVNTYVTKNELAEAITSTLNTSV